MGWSPLIHTRFHVPRATLDTTSLTHLSYTGLSPSMAYFPTYFQQTCQSILQSKPQKYYYLWFRLLLFRSPLLQESITFFLFLQVLRCFSSLRSPLTHYFTHVWITRLLLWLSFLIRISMARWIFAPPHCFSQLITSFFGSWCLGIHLMLFVA